MKRLVGIRREDKNRWERRVPLSPKQVEELKRNYPIDFVVQSSPIRIFPDEAYLNVGASVRETLSPCPVIFAVKEIPVDLLEPKKTYVFFSHTIKGQPHNMPMLKKIMSLGCQLIDYERFVDDSGRRLIAFGRFAGLAGMIESLVALGKRLNWEGIRNPFVELRHAYQYESLEQAKMALTNVGKKIETDALPRSITPLICGIAGYGNVSRGTQEILDCLPILEIAPEEISSVINSSDYSKNRIYKVVFKEKDIVEPTSSDAQFNLQDYYKNPGRYRPKFSQYLPYLTVLINAIYWEKRYPRLVTKEGLKRLYEIEKRPRLRIIGDISCDIEGAIECTTHAAEPDEPFFVYNPFNGQTTKGYEGMGPVIMAVDNLPCEFSAESSTSFGEALKAYVPSIVLADYSLSFEDCDLPPVIKRATIVYHGELTQNYRYLEGFLEGS